MLNILIKLKVYLSSQTINHKYKMIAPPAIFAHKDTLANTCCLWNILIRSPSLLVRPSFIFLSASANYYLCTLSFPSALVALLSVLGWRYILDIFLSSVTPRKSELKQPVASGETPPSCQVCRMSPRRAVAVLVPVGNGKSDLWPCRVFLLAARTEPAPIFSTCTQKISGVHGPSATKLLLIAMRLFPICVNELELDLQNGSQQVFHVFGTWSYKL